MNRVQSFLLIFCWMVLAFPMLAQTQNAPSITLENPHNTIYVHLYYLQLDSYRPDLAAQTLYGVADSTKAERLAIQLKQILDGAGLFVRLNQLPQDANYVDTISQRVFYTLFPDDLPEIYLEKRNGKWYYSEETVSLIPALHKQVYPLGSDILINAIPKFGERRFLGLALWQFLGILILVVVGYIVYFILKKIIQPMIGWGSRAGLRNSEDYQIEDKLIGRIAHLGSLVFVIELLKIFLPPLQLPIRLMEYVMVGLRILSAIFIVLILLRILDVVMVYLQRLADSTASKMDEQLLPIIKRSFQVLFVLGAIIQVMRILDLDVTALIAGISIGGLALALAAQDTVKNLIGSAMIFVDQPFQIGDWIEGSGFAGTVVEVGFRTTRIQRPDTSIISVPNGTVANMAITNVGMRIHRLFQMTIGIAYDTPPDLIKQYIYGLRKIVQSHPSTVSEGYYVNLMEMADSSLNILFRLNMKVEDFAGELQTKQELLLGVIRLAEELGIQFAFPSSSVYVEQFPGKEMFGKKYPSDPVEIEKRIEDFLEKYKKGLGENA